MTNIKIQHIIALLLTTLMTVACGNEDIHHGKTPIARVFDSYLYYEDLGDIVPKGASSNDSTLLVQQYITVWVKQQLMIKKAELNLKPEEMDVQKQLDEYRNNLLIYKYKDAFVKENLDTVVTLEQMEEYYHSTPDNFILNTPAVRCIFVQILDTPEDVYNVQRLLNFHSEKDSLALLDFCHEKAAKFETFDNHWTTLAQASNLMPTAVSEKDFALKAHGVIRINEGAYVYLLKIRDFMPAGDVMPYEMAEPSISMILLNKRKTEIINRLEKSIFDNAERNKNIEYYSSEKQQN
ncbi:MAG: peptidyl-prolyl cis-trans isomerase [Bacteroidales bacterium]|nr:peptidyl-prolyl cis-trans isomerase [Bacteroidales bacterium]MBP5681706.1 peptidyl-prolyl cis-trans isomerase [Bacteroidales bacterium]